MCECVNLRGFTHRNFGLGGLGKGPNLVQAASDLQAAGYEVQAAPSSNLLDAFGSQNRTFVEYAAIGAGLLLLVKLMK